MRILGFKAQQIPAVQMVGEFSYKSFGSLKVKIFAAEFQPGSSNENTTSRGGVEQSDRINS
jgi:hypothetical protein